MKELTDSHFTVEAPLMNSEDFADYRCVDCMSELDLCGFRHLRCPKCSRLYPVIHQIAILTERPNILVKKHHDALAERKAELVKTREYTRCSKGGGPPSQSQERMEHVLCGLTQSVELMEEVMQPVADYLENSDIEPFSSTDWLFAQEIGYKFWEALPNFYADWARTPEFEFVEALIVNGLLQYRRDADKVAVLGAGACGIAKSSAAHFTCTYAVDLSIPSLLLAQALLHGKSVDICCKCANWRPIHLDPGRSDHGEIRLLAADVNRLPFSDGALSAVVTQYMMDILDSPLKVAAEIRRVLKPDGIWINFSIPFCIPGEPASMVAPGISEVKTLLEPLGLDLIEGRRERFSVWNFDKIYPGGGRQEDEVHFLFLRRSIRTPAGHSVLSRSWQSAQRTDEWWRQVPRLTSGKEVQILHRQVLTSTGATDITELKIGKISVPQASVAFLEALFRQVNAKRTLGDIWVDLRRRAVEISESQFFELVQHLVNQCQILHLQ